MKKTAIGSAIEAQEETLKKAKTKRDSVQKDTAPYFYYDTVIIECGATIRVLRSLLPTEQSQIEEAFNEGRAMADTDFPGEHPFIRKWDRSQDYFTQTYKTTT